MIMFLQMKKSAKIKAQNKKDIKNPKLRTKNQKIIIFTVAAFTIINFLAVLAFFIYLYFWMKVH